jgi:hypothetical protein
MTNEFDCVPDYGIVFFDNVVKLDYTLFKSGISDEGELLSIKEVLERRKSLMLTWNDIATFDLIVLKYVDLGALKRKVKSMRATFAAATTLEPSPPSLVGIVDLDQAGASEIDLLRTEYGFLISEYCQRAGFISAAEHLRRKLLRRGTFFTLIFFLIVAVFVLVSYFLTPEPGISSGISPQIIGLLGGISAWLMVIFAGMSGAFLSILQRLLNTDHTSNPIAKLSLLSDNWLSIFLTPLTGAIFAVILYLFFAAHLISGSVFPELVLAPKSAGVEVTGGVRSNENAPPDTNADCKLIDQPLPVQFVDFLTTAGPKSGIDYALLLLWSFIAGFAERFVPDNLMRLVRQQSKTDDSKADT